MNHDETRPALRAQVAAWLDEISDEQLAALVQRSRDAALSEVQHLLTEMMVPALLERLAPTADIAHTDETLADPAPADPASADPASADPAPQIEPRKTEVQQEIAAIRAQLARNEERLRQMQPEPPPSDPAPPLTETITSAAPTIAVPIDIETDEVGYYVYGVLRQDAALPSDKHRMPGIDPTHAVYLLPGPEVQALVSQVSLAEFGEEAFQHNVQDMAWLEAKVQAHQNVLLAVLSEPEQPVVPLKFGTIYRSAERVSAMLADYQAELVTLLERLAGKQEWGVKAFSDPTVLAQHIEATSSEVQALRAQIEQKSSGAAYFLQKKLANVVAQERERYEQEVAHASHTRLSNHASEAVSNPVQSRELTGSAAPMILNGAYLVARAEVPPFTAAVEALQEWYTARGIRFELTGPWPPYNFVALQVQEAPTEVEQHG